MQEIGFDIIGDLYLTPQDSFDWEGKTTSLYCILVGNVSSDIEVIEKTINHLAKLYLAVFYVPGKLEYEFVNYQSEKLFELINLIDEIPNVCLLHQHVAVIDGIALLGINGWNNDSLEDEEDLIKLLAREEDIKYLKRSITKLQRHLDIKKIVLISNSVPLKELYYKENPDFMEDQIELSVVLEADTEKKVTHWVFGTHNKIVDTTINNINYVNNPKPSNGVYWAKRLTISVGI